MSRIVISKMIGLNSSKASLQLAPGEMQGIQNVMQRSYDNFAKRKGVEFVSSQTSPVLGIFDFDLDNITIPLVISGDTLQFFPNLATDNGTLQDPDPYPPSDSLDAPGNRIAVFLVEQTMRAIQDRRVVAGGSAWSWPNLIFASDGSRLNGNTGIAVASYPANNLYGPDLAFHDSFYGNPAGTRAAALVNSVIGNCLDTINLAWIKTISGVSSVVLYTSSIFPTASSATRANFSSKLNECKVGIRKLTTIQGTATQVNVEDKSGTAQDVASGSCTDGTDPCGYANSTSYAITGWTNPGFFTIPSLPACFTSTTIPPDTYTGGIIGGGAGVGLWFINDPSLGTEGVIRVNNTGTGGLSRVILTSDINTAYGQLFGVICYSGTCGSVTWTLDLSLNCLTGTAWLGTKTGGTTPAGTYTFVSGCATSPATITLS